MKKIILIYCLILLTTITHAQTSPTLMKVGDAIVSTNEFIKAYQQNFFQGKATSKTLRHFVTQYGLYIMKRLEMEREEPPILLPTNAKIQRQFLGTTEPEMQKQSAVQEQAFVVFNKIKKIVEANGGMRRGTELFIPLRQTATKAQEQQAKEAIENVYAQLTNGHSVATYPATQMRAYGISVTKRPISWTIKGENLPQTENILFSLKAQETSKPFLDVDGFHIITLEEIKNTLTYNDVKEVLLEHLQQQSTRKQADKESLQSEWFNLSSILEGKQPINESLQRGEEPSDITPFLDSYVPINVALVAFQEKAIKQQMAKTPNTINSFFERYKKNFINKNITDSAQINKVWVVVQATYKAHLQTQWEQLLQKKYPLMVDKKQLKAVKKQINKAL